MQKKLEINFITKAVQSGSGEKKKEARSERKEMRPKSKKEDEGAAH